ncbi:MAG TPA: M28 family peptidase [Ktedonobacteraceae bacterium]
MLRPFTRAILRGPILVVLIAMFTPFTLTASTLPSTVPGQPRTVTETPGINPNFIYSQLASLATHFLKREAGYDNNLPPAVNGHDEFANYWTQEMLSLLGQFGAQAHRDPFPIQGWRGRTPTVPAVNVEVTVPGAVHPEQIVVIGCHYDGMAFSTQSANDDASGCAIELGVAQAMSEFWSKNHLYPDRTLRFVIFDAEESGLLGSYHYVNSTTNSDLQNIVAMFNEEQNGINYPLRYLGNMSNPLMPYYIDMSPLQSNRLYDLSSLTPRQQANISQFRQLMQQAVAAAFQQFRAMGDQMLTYHGASGQDVWQPIFTSNQLSNIHLDDDTLGSSDQMPFTMAGLPCATLVGNSTYYDHNAPAGSYPFDQPGDTLQLMNTFADDTASQSQALTLALGLPGMITTWMLSQPAILGQVPADGKPIAAINSLGAAPTGQAINFMVGAAYDPAQAGATLRYHWNFGDGASADGQSASHAYTRAGTYILSLTITSSHGGVRTITRPLTIGQPPAYNNPYSGYISNGMPSANPLVALPVPKNGPGDRVSSSSSISTGGQGSIATGGAMANPHPNPISLPGWLVIGMGILLIAVVIIVILRRAWRP